MSITRVTAQNAELYRQAEIKKIDRRQAELLQEEQRVHEQLAANEKKRIEANRLMNRSGQNVDKMA
jgi:galactokinase